MSDAPTISPELAQLFPKLCKPRKRHRCRLCYGIIEVKEPCCRWSTLDEGEGYATSHAHPECYQVTLDEDWSYDTWECSMPGDINRPKTEAQP